MTTRTDSRAQPRPRAEVPVHPGTLRLDSESSNRNSRRLGRPNSWDIASRRNFLNLEVSFSASAAPLCPELCAERAHDLSLCLKWMLRSPSDPRITYRRELPWEDLLIE